MSDIMIMVHPVKIKRFVNAYSERLKNNRFIEMIRVDKETCVYKRWSSTRYELSTIPTSHGLIA